MENKEALNNSTRPATSTTASATRNSDGLARVRESLAQVTNRPTESILSGSHDSVVKGEAMPQPIYTLSENEAKPQATGSHGSAVKEELLPQQNSMPADKETKPQATGSHGSVAKEESLPQSHSTPSEKEVKPQGAGSANSTLPDQAKNASQAYRIVELAASSNADEAVPAKKTTRATLEKKKLSQDDTTLIAVREKAGDKAIPKNYEFVYENGSHAADTTEIHTYLAISNEESEVPSKLETIFVREQASKTTHPSAVLSTKPFMIKVVEWKASEAAGTVQSSILSKTLDAKKLDAATLTLAALRKLAPKMSAYPRIHSFCTPDGTTVNDETLTFSEYLALDPKGTTDAQGKSKDEVAALPAVKLYFKSSNEKNNPQDSAPAAKAPDIDLTLKERTGEKTADTWKKTERNSILDSISDMKLDSDNSSRTAGSLHEAEWTLVLRNSGVLFGWRVNRQSRTIERAPKQAFQLRDKEGDNAKQSANITLKQPGPGDASVTSSSGQNSDPSNAPSRDLIPNFRVNDDSRIDITACEHEFEVSMARNDFSSQSTEASVSGGMGGWSASVSAGFASSKSSSSKSTQNEYEKTLVARYMFPRCDVFLYPDDLEPTKEFAAAIQKVEQSLNINELRKLHSDFGQLFCQNVTLGGRLLSTKVVKTTAETSETELKQQFKTSIGASVSTPIGVGASMKHEQESGSSQQNNQTNRTQNETNVFEAVGGDTIAVIDPAEWAPSVEYYQFWRVINRDMLIPILDILVQMPRYREVKSLFLKAVPALQNFVELNDDRAVTARLKVDVPTNNLTSFASETGLYRATYYLGHRPSMPVAPYLNTRGEAWLRTFWVQTTPLPQNRQLIFSPSSYKAPTLIGYYNRGEGAAEWGTTYSAQFLETIWDITAPFDKALVNGCRVVLKTRPYEGRTTEAGNPQPAGQAVASHMVVFRNQQGVFLPAMSDSDEEQYWRITKGWNDKPGEPFKNGDQVRLCWSFKDQTAGWRDYDDDVFGRRRYGNPPEVPEDFLYLKIPWPRFESVEPKRGLWEPSAGHAMIMARSHDYFKGGAGQIPIRTLPGGGIVTYDFQDVVFRFDRVSNGGTGDVGDYMLRDFMQGSDIRERDATRFGTFRSDVKNYQWFYMSMTT